MIEPKISLASDNCSPAHPLIIEAVKDANNDWTLSYGLDPWTEKVEVLIKEAFKSPCQVYMVPTGTGSNVFGLQLACRRHESVICSELAHTHYQESGAVEAIVGCKLLTVPHELGKIKPEAILKRIQHERNFGKHSTSPKVLSIAQPTEAGTVYSLEELKKLKELCRKENLYFHIDGSRLYNAAAALGASLSEFFLSAKPDILSLGGTKNGLMLAEALLIFNPDLEEGSSHLHKQVLQLTSKMRYLSAQFIPFFQNELWKDLAISANNKALEIAAILEKTPGVNLTYPVQTNQIFFTVPPEWIPLIQEEIYCYIWDPEIHEIRFIASWDTSLEDVKGVKDLFLRLST